MENTTTAASAAASAGQKAQQEGNRIFTQTVDQLKEGVAATTRNTEQAMAYGQNALETMFRAGEAYNRGAQDLLRQAAASFQARFEEGCAVARALPAGKASREAIEGCSSLIQSCFSDFGRQINGWMKLNEQSLSLLAQANRATDRSPRQG